MVDYSPFSANDSKWARAEFAALCDFGARAKTSVGFGSLDADGEVDEAAGRQLWINCRMTHVFALAAELGSTRGKELAEYGIQALNQLFYDPDFGGFYSALDGFGTPIPESGERKEGYAHAFVLLAACSGRLAGIAGAEQLYRRAIAAHEEHFWDTTVGLTRESWNREFTETEDYRGANANMHTVEAMLAAWDVSAETRWLSRSLGVIRFIFTQSEKLSWRIGEHFTRDWEFLPDYNRERPADPFRPFGATPGHGLEWSRLALQTWAAIAALPSQTRTGILSEAQYPVQSWSHLPEIAYKVFSRAVSDGWSSGANGQAPGIVYTTDFSGKPVVRQRMHWTICEGIDAAAVFARYFQQIGDTSRTNECERLLVELCEYARHFLIEQPGHWRHELDENNLPNAATWPGKPDIYHAAQAMLMPIMPLTPCFTKALSLRQDRADLLRNAKP